MKIKDFEVGQTVFILDMHIGRNTEPNINERKVHKVGRKYVTLEAGNQYCTEEWFEIGLVESKDWGDRSYLLMTREDAERAIEKHNLETWLSALKTHRRGEYSLEQLRAVKKILS